MNSAQFESDDNRDRRETPWRKNAPPLNKPPTNPDYQKQPFNYDEWMKTSKKMEEDESDTPKPGDTIRTKKMQMEGKVESIGQNRAGYAEVLFRVGDGRLMKTPVSNVIVVEKLADEDEDIMEVSTEKLAQYKTAAGADARAADKAGDTARGNKRFHGIVQATKKQFANDAKKHVKEGPNDGSNDNFTVDDIKRLETIRDLPTLQAQAKVLIKGKAARRMKPEKIAYFYDKIDGMTRPMAIIKLMYDLLLSGEGNSVIGTPRGMKQNTYRDRFGEGSMGGINRCAPAQDVSYEKMLDEIVKEQELNELSVDTMKSYKQKVKSPDSTKKASLYRLNKDVEGSNRADQKIRTKTGDRSGPNSNRAYEEKLAELLAPMLDEVYQGPHVGDPQKLAKAPKSSMQGSSAATFSQLVQDTIAEHGVKWAVEYYVKKHGLPPRQFRIFAGI